MSMVRRGVGKAHARRSGAPDVACEESPSIGARRWIEYKDLTGVGITPKGGADRVAIGPRKGAGWDRHMGWVELLMLLGVGAVAVLVLRGGGG